MNIILSAELEKFVQEQIKSGSFNSKGEVIKEALMLMQDHQSLKAKNIEKLKHEINKGLEDIKHGRVLDPDVVYKHLQDRIARKAKENS